MTDIRLFAYGTLRDPAVQHALFGRRLDEREDVLTGYRLDWVDISDETVVGLSGSARHKILRWSGDPADRIEGAMLTIDARELAIADHYETDAYVRVESRLASGQTAFVYVEPAACP